MLAARQPGEHVVAGCVADRDRNVGRQSGAEFHRPEIPAPRPLAQLRQAETRGAKQFAGKRALQPAAQREPAATTTLFTLAALQIEAERLLGVPVDVLTPKSLPRGSRERCLREANPG